MQVKMPFHDRCGRFDKKVVRHRNAVQIDLMAVIKNIILEPNLDKPEQKQIF